MTSAVLFTAFNRPGYFASTLESWDAVVGKGDWDWFFSIDASDISAEMAKLAQDFLLRNNLPGEVIVQPVNLGVLEHPYVGFERLFDMGYDFVLRAEDDLVVSDDILTVTEEMESVHWADARVIALCLSADERSDPAVLSTRRAFSPHVWGTWAARWRGIIGPTWDHDYSTGTTDYDAGWDWNLDKRIIPRSGYLVGAPVRTRVRHIGVVGVHSTPAIFGYQKHYLPHYGVDHYTLE